MGDYGSAVNVVMSILWGLGFLWIEVADKGDHLLVTTGPCRWAWCGWGKEKVKYSEIRDYEVTKSCWFMSPGLCCSGVWFILYALSRSLDVLRLPTLSDRTQTVSECITNRTLSV